MASQGKTLIIGAAGAVGKRLCTALAARGHRVIASDRMEKLPGSLARSMGELGTTHGGVDVTDGEALKALFREHADEHTTVWNLAAPLSVETAMDPAVAEAVTIGGMEKARNSRRRLITTRNQHPPHVESRLTTRNGTSPQDGAA